MNTEETFQRLRALKPNFKDMNIKRMAIFGSHVRGEARPESDVDILIDLIDKDISLFEFMDIQHTLEDHIQAKVDLLTFDSIHPALKDRILGEAKDV